MKQSIQTAGILTALCLGLTGCGVEAPVQEKAADSKEALTHFLTDLQEKDFQSARAYLKEGNQLIHVFAAMEGESVPMMDGVYQKVCQEMGDFTYTLEDGPAPSIVMVKMTSMDYGTAIETAMSEAIRTQTQEGGDAFTDVAGWITTGLETAEMGEEQEYHCVMTGKDGGYFLEHRGYPDVDFLNGITGGFYDYADVKLTTCTGGSGGQKQVSYIVSMGDRIIGYIETTTEPFDTAAMTSEEKEAFAAQVSSGTEELEGVYSGVQFGEGEITLSIGIDFNRASSTMLMKAGIVNGKYNFNFGDKYLSLSSTIHGFEKGGMVCETVPQYGKD